MNPVFQTVRWMAEAIRTKQISARELMQAHLDRIAVANPALNAIVELDPEAALKAADHADAQREPRGPLHGVPMTVKGAWDCAGMNNTAGTLGRKGHVAQQDATVIARMRRAGAIPFAVTNLPEFSLAFESDNLVYGRSNNPFDATRTPGGSGGGGAAAIASGCSPFEVGGDMGGSIRLPCHNCGIAGLKPTLGRVPLSGYFPGPFGLVTLLATAGPMARSVDDLYPLLELLSGPDGLDANVADARQHDPARVDVSRLRIAFHTDNGVIAPSSETSATVMAAAKALSATEVTMGEIPLTGSYDIYMGLLGADGGAGLAQLTTICGTAENSAIFRGIMRLLAPRATNAEQFAALLFQRDVFRSQVAGFFQNYDVLLCPVNAYPALPHGTSWDHVEAFSYTMAHNLSGCPAATVRFGTSSEGLPIGVQVVAGHWREDIALAVAARLESMTPPTWRSGS
ncbi:MAG: amidase [Bryobacteraceae bacterium]|nr:amidase [Bryobacteraceae bacterium]